MCTRNLATECGIVNGALGTVIGFIYLREKGGRHPIQPQLTDQDVAAVIELMQPIVLVQFDELTRRIKCKSFSNQLPNVVPMVATTTKLKNGVERLQLPLALATCITIHKSQGQSITNIVLFLSYVGWAG